MTSREQLSHSVATPSVHSFAAKLAATVSLKPVKDVSTPSVHTRAAAAKTNATKAPGAPMTVISQTRKNKSRSNLPSLATLATFDHVANLPPDQPPDCDFRLDSAPYPRHLKKLDGHFSQAARPASLGLSCAQMRSRNSDCGRPKDRYKLQVAKSAHLHSRHTAKVNEPPCPA